MQKKGDKSLNMIFGLFLLLIISLVVLNLFFKFTEKSTKTLESSSTEYYSKAAIDNVKQQCQLACDGIVDDNTLIEYCRKFSSVDWNGDNIVKGQKVRLGKWEFCEEKVPCMVLIDNCPKATGKTCKDMLTNPELNSLDYYDALAQDGLGDKCQLSVPTDLVQENIGNNVFATPNWKIKYGIQIRSGATGGCTSNLDCMPGSACTISTGKCEPTP